MRLRGSRLLIVDDHADLADNLREILEGEDASVAVAATAADAEVAAEQPFDVALVDVRLPDATGLSLVPRLKNRTSASEVVLVTGHASIDDAVEAVRSGAYAYVLKPFDAEDLVVTVAHALEQVRLRRRAAALQAALERSEAALRTLVETVQALLLVLDHEGRVMQANPAVAAAAGVDIGRLLGADWIAEFVPPRDRARARAAFARVGAGAPDVSLETSVVHVGDDGSLGERVVRWRLAGLHVGEGHRIYASGLDVTDVRELERRTRLAEKLAAVGTVSAGLAHEIRNPLNAAGLQLQLLERRIAKVADKVDEATKLREPMDLVRGEIERLSRLVTEFLQFARPTALAARDSDLSMLLREVVELERPVGEERGVSMELCVPEAPVVVEIDRERIKQVALNLVRNALEASECGGHVRVAVERDGAGGRFVVRDDGDGIPAENIGRIFEPFFTTKDGGTGLGMAIAHSLIDLHGGGIEVRAAPEGPGPVIHGAEFIVTLPRRVPKLE